MAKRVSKFVSILAVVLGALILIRPELLSWIVALYLVVWGLSNYFE